MKYVIPDTNVILENRNVIKALIDKGYYVVIPITVLDELDKLKSRTDVGFNAREAIRAIEQEKGKNLILTGDYEQDPILDLKNQDRKILAVALLYKRMGKEIIILSKDLGMRLAAKSFHIEANKEIEETATSINETELEKKDKEIRFYDHGQDLVNRVREILGQAFIPKYNKTGITFFGSKGRILKLVNNKNYFIVEFNVPVTSNPGLITLTDKEAREKKMGTCRWIYKGDSLSTVLRLVEEAARNYY